VLDEQSILQLPIDELGLEVLRDFDRTGQWNDYNYVNQARNAGYAKPALNALSEAIGWLRARGLVTPDLSESSGNAAFVTRFGRKLLDEGPGHLHATAGLQDGVHPLIEREARSQFMLEKYELGVFAAMRAVEIRVRNLGGFGEDDYGVGLLNQAFGPGGPLCDLQATKGEQDGMRALFAGAYAVLRNPGGHREVDYDDPGEAAEAVHAVSLLMRILDRVEAAQQGDS
jgi:uncharacterized protein (TIGR02391 family)